MNVSLFKRTLPPRACGWLLPMLLLAAAGCGSRAPQKPVVESRRLPNGLDLVAVYMPRSTNLTIFTYLPMGLAGDGPKQAQWSHLVEHMIIRSTVPAASPEANAETMADHMRLDFYGTVDQWKEGLKHTVNWLRGLPFPADQLASEKANASAEGDFTVQNLATHKFAVAAWNQAYRHNQTHAAVQGDLERASLAEIQKHRDERLPLLSKTVVCVVGGLAPDKVFADFGLPLGSVTSLARPPVPVPLHPGNREVTWDLNARHMLITWPVPGPLEKDHAALLILGTWLNLQLAKDPELQKRAGIVLARPDLVTPEGSFFYISASLRPDAIPSQVRGRVGEHLAQILSDKAELKDVALIGQQLANALTSVIDPTSLQDQLPPNMTLAMLERNLGLQQGMQEFLYGDKKAAQAKELLAVDGSKMQQAILKYLSIEKSSTITFRPVATAPAAPAAK